MAFGRIAQLRAISLVDVVTASWTGILLISLVLNTRTASAVALPSVKDTMNDILLPNPNRTAGPLGEIQCYALPYGAIGIISHLLTYWTMAWIAVGRTPIWPWHRLDTWKYDIVLSLVTLVTCVPIASITIHRCRITWHFILIGVWKLVTSISLACTTIHRALIIRQQLKSGISTPSAVPLKTYGNSYPHTAYSPYTSPSGSGHSGIYQQPGNSRSGFFEPDDVGSIRPQPNNKPLYWLILYFAGTVTGMVGLLALVYTSFRHNQDVRSLTIGFAVVIAILPILTAIYWYKKHLDMEGGGRVMANAMLYTTGGAFLSFFIVFGFFSALYSDLVLGAIAQKWSGAPSEDYAALYWAWFVAKRFPMLSF